MHCCKGRIKCLEEELCCNWLGALSEKNKTNEYLFIPCHGVTCEIALPFLLVHSCRGKKEITIPSFSPKGSASANSFKLNLKYSKFKKMRAKILGKISKSRCEPLHSIPFLTISLRRDKRFNSSRTSITKLNTAAHIRTFFDNVH